MISRRVERLVPPAGSFVDVDGARVHYVDRGEGRPVVMIHGLAGVLQNFTHSLVDRLAENSRVIVLDRPGAGYSIRHDGTSAGLRTQAATIASFIRALGLERPLVVGHSLGGAIALALALDFPEVPRALALIAPLTQAAQRAPKPFRTLEISSPWMRRLVAHTVAVPLSMFRARDAVRGIFAPEPVPADFATAGGGLLGLRPMHFYHASSDLIAARDDMPHLVQRYGELQLPVHILFGMQDAVLSYERHAEPLRSQIPHVAITLVRGGHMLPVTQPDVVAPFLVSCAT
ncbi:MAG: alpha/beta hydrolase [Candidatus Eremiobacteraeota bacterium]|nr:alpha/beta hydrolase [Candidatus Eremiobacteraeota bacterium]